MDGGAKLRNMKIMKDVTACMKSLTYSPHLDAIHDDPPQRTWAWQYRCSVTMRMSIFTLLFSFSSFVL